MLKVENLSTSYKVMGGKVNVINDVSFTVNKNEIFGIAGESGCGKTTLLKVLYDIIDPPLQIEAGRVVFETEKNGETLVLESGSISKAWWDSVTYVPQAAQSVLNPIMPLRKQFLDSIGKQQLRKEGQSQVLNRVGQYMTELNLSPDLLNAYPFQLSGGMRQRIIIALATFMGPSLVLADEPTTALDVVVQRSILMLLMRLQKQHENTLVIVSHDMGVHYQITNRMGIMYAGVMVEIGQTERVFSTPMHPYTQMLVNALPRVGDSSQRVGIPGRPPSLLNPPSGCRFAERCPKATEECKIVVPEFKQVDEDHFAACHKISGRWGA
jgi:peptide/nickel transport system ATP-binding protein